MIDWLMRPRVRRFRRWSFVLTFPAAIVVARVFGIEDGVLVLATPVALWCVVALSAWRLQGERGEALRDLLMHPRARAYARAELDVLSVIPRVLLVWGRSKAVTYHRGTYGAAVAFAFTPAVAAEGLVFHLIVGGGWLAWVTSALHVYSLIWLWGYALGPRAFPHRVGSDTAIFRNGAWYRVRVPLRTISSATARRERVVRDGLQERDGVLLLASRRRVDVFLELSEPVRVSGRSMSRSRPARWVSRAMTPRASSSCCWPPRPRRSRAGRWRGRLSWRRSRATPPNRAKGSIDRQ